MSRALRRFAALVAATAAFAVADARAGGRLPCREAAVFPRAAVNALILPYRAEGLDPMRLSALAQQEVLFSMLKYRSVGATELTGEPEQCDVRTILQKVNRGDGNSLLKGGGLVLIWGRVYEQEGEVYLQSYVRLLRSQTPEALRAELRSGDAKLELEGRLIAPATALAPRRMTKKDFAEIERRAKQALVVRESPEENAPTKVLPISPTDPLSYSVIQTQGEWMRIQSLGDTRLNGWVRARKTTPEWSLRRFMPELAYVDGIVGYLRLMAGVRQDAERSQVLVSMRDAFREYEKAVGPDASPQAQALARSLTALALWNDPERRAEAAKLFAEALDFAPSAPDIRVLAAITAPALSGQAADKETLSQLNRSLLGALAVDPANPAGLGNLERLYTFAARSPATSPYPPDELRTRIASIRSSRPR